MIKTSEIDFSKITPTQFEELVFKLLIKTGFKKVKWRQGAADNGRDIQATLFEENKLVGIVQEEWFFEVKHYSNGVPPVEFDSKFAWANAEKPQHLVFILSSHITNNGDVYLQKRIQDTSYHVHIIQGNELKEILVSYPEILREFNLIEGYSALLDFVKDIWVVKETLPNWTAIATTIEASNFSSLLVSEKLFLLSMLIIHDTLNNYQDFLSSEDQDYVSDLLQPSYEMTTSAYFSLAKDNDREFDIDFDKLVWLSKKNFGELEYYEDEELYWQYSGLINLVEYDGQPGILGLLTSWKDGSQVVKPFFLVQDSSLTLRSFKSINTDVEDFIMMYKSQRPKSIDKRENYLFDTLDISVSIGGKVIDNPFGFNKKPSDEEE